jgi:hypothetical protein
MNYPIAAACGLTLLAFVAHMAGGVRQSLSIEPSKVAGQSASHANLKVLDRNWVQTVCAVQLVSVDLLALKLCVVPSQGYKFKSAFINQKTQQSNI